MKIIPGYPRYQATEDGKIIGPYDKPLKHRVYFQIAYVRVYANGVQDTYAVAELVCMTFHGPRPGRDYSVAFIDGDRTNVAASNLAWSDNPTHVRLGRRRGHCSEHVAAKIRQERKGRGRPTLKALGARYGLSKSHVGRILKGERWKTL